MIPPSGMQFPMFDKGMPLAVNYGGMGSYIANALIKPYDEFGEFVAVQRIMLVTDVTSDTNFFLNNTRFASENFNNRKQGN